jgi:4-diphosphocytidyl-2C-methyl-D-erythritol kinase
MINFKNFRSALNETVSQVSEATVTFELMNSDDEEELTDLMNHISIEAESMSGSGNKYILTFKSRKDAQKYAKELEDMGITKQDPKVK